MNYKFSFLGKLHNVELKEDRDSYAAIVDKKEYNIKDCSITGNSVTIEVGDRRIRMYTASDKDLIHVVVNGECYTFESTADQVQKAKASFDSRGNSVASPMPGLLVKLPVKVGDIVKKNRILAVVEAMKMQNELRSPCDGTVKSINYKEGDQVDALKPIVELEPAS
jgi:biotin carboxyl carrier protein